MVIVGVGCLGSCGIEGWAREKSCEMVSGTGNGNVNGSGDGRYLRFVWMPTGSRAQAGNLRSRTKHFDRRVRRLVVGNSDLDDQRSLQNCLQNQ